MGGSSAPGEGRVGGGESVVLCDQGTVCMGAWIEAPDPWAVVWCCSRVLSPKVLWDSKGWGGVAVRGAARAEGGGEICSQWSGVMNGLPEVKLLPVPTVVCTRGSIPIRDLVSLLCVGW